jgi:hypothetical protein
MLINMQVLGRAWFGGSGGGKKKLLPYVEARHRIYLPAYRWMLQHKVQPQLRRIAQATLEHNVVLLDYETNLDVADASRPLSHAIFFFLHMCSNTSSAFWLEILLRIHVNSAALAKRQCPPPA